jgi:hypothetical protein
MVGCVEAGVVGVEEGVVHGRLVGRSGGKGSGETACFSLPHRQGGIAPAARRLAIWSITQFDSKVLSCGVSGRSWSLLRRQLEKHKPLMWYAKQIGLLDSLRGAVSVPRRSRMRMVGGKRA